MIAVLSPHLDDAVISAWSAIRDARGPVVVNVCDGVPPPGTLASWDRVTGATDSATRMRERLEEDREALAIAGCPSVSLGLLDVQYRGGPLDSARLEAAIRDAVAGADEVWAPAGIGGHSDHVQVRAAAFALAARGGPPVRLYADLPYAVKHGWPAWVTGEEPDPGFSHDVWWARHLPADVGLERDARRLDADELATKLRAVDCYRTQIRGLDQGPLGLLRHPMIAPFEVSWAVRAPAGEVPAPAAPAART